MDEVTLQYIVLMLAVVPWVLYLLLVTFYVVSIIYRRLHMYRPHDVHLLTDDLPGVSIIKPLMGVDPYLETNLESHFTLDYPKFEVLLCVQDENDPAIEVARNLMSRYPKVESTLFLGGRDGILNPMVHNMCPAYDCAKYPIIWISTSRIKVNTDILQDMVGRFRNPKVALVHQLPFTTDQPGLAAAVEKVSFGANMARFYLAFNTLGISCFTGMSYLIRKSALDDLQGLAWFGRYLAEDFFIAKVLQENGYTQQLSTYPAYQNVYKTSIVAYKDRMVRWLCLRLNMLPLVAGVLEPLGESLVLGVYASWSAHYLIGVDPYVWFGCHCTVWCTLDYIQLRGIQNGPLPFSVLMYMIAWIVRELLCVYIYFEAILNSRRIRWGKKTYRLSRFGTTMEVVSDTDVLPI